MKAYFLSWGAVEKFWYIKGAVDQKSLGSTDLVNADWSVKIWTGTTFLICLKCGNRVLFFICKLSNISPNNCPPIVK